ncbi:MAG: zinc dependent phospholipase C family protein [Dehalococcoidia bacterium]|jgi:hypothetical protein|nr:MAG: Zinc dependent phospholipase C [Chloroflexota bacterium]|tara:strand:+ start:2925 stop:3668 length:744 start_codon:yes stop_codon:yes gene_type:complete
MPGLCLHLSIGNSIINKTNHSAIKQSPGSFLLGTTAPDIRTITGQNRELTHFFNLAILEPQYPIINLNKQYPNILNILQSDSSASSFIAGYITHLISDQRYIELIYRKYFFSNDFINNLKNNLYDRTLQYELDRIVRSDNQFYSKSIELINNDVHNYNLPFINDFELSEWNIIMQNIISQPASFDRYPRMMMSHLTKLGYAFEHISEHLGNANKIIEESMNIVGNEFIKIFIDDTVDECIKLIEELA